LYILGVKFILSVVFIDTIFKVVIKYIMTTDSSYKLKQLKKEKYAQKN